MSRWEALGIAESLSPHHKANDMIRRDGKLDVPLTVEDECLSEGFDYGTDGGGLKAYLKRGVDAFVPYSQSLGTK